MRTASQNRLYWKWVQIMADFIGYDKNVMHEKLLTLYAEKRTSEMDSSEMHEYMRQVEIFAIEFLEIVLPNNDDYDNFISNNGDS